MKKARLMEQTIKRAFWAVKNRTKSDEFSVLLSVAEKRIWQTSYLAAFAAALAKELLRLAAVFLCRIPSEQAASIREAISL